MSEQKETLIVGGGCFWCTDAVFSSLDGVESVEPGYAGGRTEYPTYEEICQGGTGHIEVVRVTFDPSRIQAEQLLEVFFASHDPTSRDRQGNDVGEQYRSVIFYASEAQHVAALAVRDRLQAEGLTDGVPIVTEILPAPVFWPAESEHADYFARNPWQGYCQFVIAPKVSAMRKKFARLQRSE
ncbi:peptide-methionine (S)-S-oxide reductase [Bordetella sp. J329]|uniref:peptide-methionine (S)-S-oxide reductase MsrA n=1 Tax=Kerstersia gyiorum TaxID=206506 RepID=UPI000FDBB3E8|nr:peptide-methionine (S)-S-oxide reductase MsrA [Kerstersia gyiorum]AZV92771.1 peptide-methionine (S)-S-oxide reductase [Bordetella sp. J329]MCH4272680.1 peptide-methionine (S)-S-oxide reductase MsrA [Kerstersia gyiorum]MCI1230047.1 peptide-methionine (S)-S-oxide reductase MsrA [Kerstersia gyiorum]